MPLDLATSLFYHLFSENKIGHRIISLMELELSKGEKISKIDIKWLRDTLQKSFSLPEFAHFKKRIINDEWMDVSVDWEKLIYQEKKSITKQKYLDKMMNCVFPENQPQWECVIVEDKYIIFVNDHTYGDGVLVTKALSCIFDNPEENNILKSKNKNCKIKILAKIYLFFKIIFQIIFRFLKKKNKNNTKDKNEPSKFCELGILSLASLKKIRENFNCSDVSTITINDILHSLIVKTNSLYFERENIYSAAMFNMRSKSTDLINQNKLGYIVLANKVKRESMPEDVLREVHDFMQFYKVTPAVPIITNTLWVLHKLYKQLALGIIKRMNQNVDFVISNYALEYTDKTLNDGIPIKNINAMVTPCDTNQMYSLISYGDKINVRVTYNNMDEARLRDSFKKALEWMGT